MLKFSENKEVVYDLDWDNIPGVPDGMTIDTNDHLWVAIYNGKRVSDGTKSTL